MQSTDNSLPENLDQVNPPDDDQSLSWDPYHDPHPPTWDLTYNLIATSCPDRLPEFLQEFPAPPSLVLYSHSAASTFNSLKSNASLKPWSRQQRRCYQRLNSWITEAWGRGCTLKRVDLTSTPSSDSTLLRKHHLELLRRINRRFGISFEFFIIETTEGYGVLHLIWASERPCFIPQRWLSAEWEKIHGANRVWIQPMGFKDGDKKRVTRYLVSQYLSGQTAFKRESWSWWRSKVSLSKAWKSFLQLTGACDISKPWAGLNWQLRSLSKQERLDGWTKLLTEGRCVLANVHLLIIDRCVTVAPRHSAKFAMVKL